MFPVVTQVGLAPAALACGTEPFGPPQSRCVQVVNNDSASSVTDAKSRLGQLPTKQRILANPQRPRAQLGVKGRYPLQDRASEAHIGADQFPNAPMELGI